MSHKLYFCGSIYKQVKHGRGVQECIQRAEGLNGHLMTLWNGKQALVTDGKLYVFAGKEKGFQRIEWEKINGRD